MTSKALWQMLIKTRFIINYYMKPIIKGGVPRLATEQSNPGISKYDGKINYIALTEIDALLPLRRYFALKKLLRYQSNQPDLLLD